MKTLEEVKKHVVEVGYTNEAIQRIVGFLIGKGLKEVHEFLPFIIGTNSFLSFYNWFNESEENIQKPKFIKMRKWHDISLNEIRNELGCFGTIIFDAALSDEILEKIMKELGFKEEKTRYKYTGEQREKLEEQLEKVKKAFSDLTEGCILPKLVSEKLFPFYENMISDIKDKLNETVD